MSGGTIRRNSKLKGPDAAGLMNATRRFQVPTPQIFSAEVEGIYLLEGVLEPNRQLLRKKERNANHVHSTQTSREP